jgi:spermidine synthase
MASVYPGFILPVWSWRTPAINIPEQMSGKFRIVKRRVKAGTAWPMCKTLGYDYCVFMNDATLTLLQEEVEGEWRDWMVDSPYEWYAMGEYAMRTNGPNVLVGGLGLGLILHHLTLRNDVEKMRVIEISKDVIQMISPYIPNDKRIEIICGDFFETLPKLTSKGEEYNTVIMDIWAGENYQCIEDFKRARILLHNYYPSALHLFHSFQKAVDMETFLISPISKRCKETHRFIPEKFAPHNK